MAFSTVTLILFLGLYAVVHSLLASLSVKAWVRHIFGPGTDRWYRLAYNAFAVITLLPLFLLLAILPDQTLYIVPTPWCWLMLFGQLLMLLGLGIAFLQTGLFDFLGLAQLFITRPAQNNLFRVDGFYRWVRHPLYSFSLLLLWLTPVMSVNLLTIYLLFTLYFYLGSIHEERRLLAEFGAAYRDYQQRVPRLIPMPGRRYE
ncbi:MAG: isoprenylcysteine carboxylmethyltransferase family protein [Anaerolineae bacterium]|nr:isoprenylcysteine carboxylmethyltransferase family protein [Anaerolineae bacterium]